MPEFKKFSELDYMILKIGLCFDPSDIEYELLEELEKRKEVE